MDEPTAALDPLAECEVYAGFDRMVGKKTALYISHRLASCRFCEDILVFGQGQVVQRGSHEELEGKEGTGSFGTPRHSTINKPNQEKRCYGWCLPR